MKILYFGYRNWAEDLYEDLEATFGEYEFFLSKNKNFCTMHLIDEIKPDLILFYGWSWIIKQDIIDKYDCFCLHPSKLPEYRGGSPIQNQIQNGVTESAVTIFKMDAGLDTGPIYFQQRLFLDESLDSIFDEIKDIGYEGTCNLIADHKRNTIKLIPQDESKATTFKRLKPSNSEIKAFEFEEHNAEYFYDKIRSLQKPYPEVYIECRKGRLIIEKARYEI